LENIDKLSDKYRLALINRLKELLTAGQAVHENGK